MRTWTFPIIAWLLAIGSAAAAVPTIGSMAPEFGGTTFFNNPAPGPVTLAGAARQGRAHRFLGHLVRTVRGGHTSCQRAA